MDCGSFSKAAERPISPIHHPYGAIKQLNNLEASVGVRLLEHINHGVKPTPAGGIFYEEAVKLMGISRDAVQRVRSAG